MTAQIPVDNVFILNQRVAEIRPDQSIDSYFLSMAINRNQAYFSERGAGTKVQNISKPNVENYEFLNPLHQEQTKIGDYFQQLDTLIAQHQQKHDKLLNLKKSLLEKMFPKQGFDVPEIRFKGFSGVWEEKNWFDTVDISTDMVDPRNDAFDELFHIGPGNIESFSGKIYNNVLKVKDSQLISGKFHFNKGDIIYGKINPQLAKYLSKIFRIYYNLDNRALWAGVKKALH